MYCKNCNKIFQNDDKFCVYCGKELILESNVDNLCKKCNSLINDNDVYCSECGCRVISDLEEEKQEEYNKHKKNVFIVFVFGFIILAILIISEIYRNQSNY